MKIEQGNYSRPQFQETLQEEDWETQYWKKVRSLKNLKFTTPTPGGRII